jgi:hypothetical protein
MVSIMLVKMNWRNSQFVKQYYRSCTHRTYPEPNANAASFQGLSLTRSSLIGPEETFPMPRPNAKNAKVIPISAFLECSFTSRMIPVQVELKEPAKKPYVTQNMYNRGSDELLSPQNRNTLMVAPMLDINMHVVTWKRSTRPPIAMQPKTLAMLMAMTVNAPASDEAFRLRWAYVGRYIMGRKKPNASMVLVRPRTMYVGDLRKLRSKSFLTRWSVTWVTGSRGLRK